MQVTYTTFLTWITFGDMACAIATPHADGIESHRSAVAAEVAEFLENGVDDLDVSEPFEAIEYHDIHEDLIDGALDGTSDDLEALGASDGCSWYGRAA